VFRDAIRLEHGKLPEHSISMFRSSLKSNLFFSYTGQTHLKTRYASVELTDYRAGGINAIGTLNLLQEIFDDRLYFFANYDSNYFNESLIASLIEEYIAQIKELISYSISTKQTKQAIAKPQIDASIEIALRQIAEEICHYPIALVDMDKDLEADLGMDSLELVRIVTRLEQRFSKMNRQALLSCRSLREIVSVLQLKQSPGKVAIITDGNGGIGQAIALNLAKQGASVAIVARNLAELAETTAQIRQLGLETLAIAGNISDPTQVEAMVKKVVSQFGDS
jgi:acyl carrier protein